MRIAMIGHKDFPSRSGGIEVVVYELATRLVKMGHEVTLYNRGKNPDGNHYFVEGAEVYRTFTFKKQSLNAMVASVTATFSALTRRYDILHFHALGPSVMIVLAKLFGRKTVATVHGLDWQRAKWNRFASAYLKLGERVIAKYADEVIVLSENVKEYFKTTYGRETTFIENAIRPIKPLRPFLIAKRFGLEKHGYILYLARIVPEKGLHYLIEAYKRIKTDKKLVIAGELPTNDYGAFIKNEAGGNKNIVFTGFVSGDTLDELYTNCALYVLPSEVEGLALTLLEAMSAGARCLVSDIPENTAVTRDFAVSFKSMDVDSLTQKLSELLNAPDENLYAKEQRAYIMENYNYENVVKKTEQIYRKALNK